MPAAQPGQWALLLLDVIDVLKSAEVRYVVPGAMAASVHCVIRASPDAGAVAFIAVARSGRADHRAGPRGLHRRQAMHRSTTEPADAAAVIEVARDAQGLVALRALVPGYGRGPAARVERLLAPPAAGPTRATTDGTSETHRKCAGGT